MMGLPIHIDEIDDRSRDDPIDQIPGGAPDDEREARARDDLMVRQARRVHPDTDERWRDADSMDLLRAVLGEVASAGWAVAHVDVTVMLERPKLAPHRDAIRDSLAAGLGSVNVKFTTGERMGFVGRGEGAAALAVATLEAIGP